MLFDLKKKYLFFISILCFSYPLLSQSRINDYASFFTEKANLEALNQLKNLDSKTQVQITTYSQIPQSQSSKNFFQSKMPTKDFSGIFVLITKKPRKIWVSATKDLNSQVSAKKVNAIREAFLNGFKTQSFDEGLISGVQTITQIFRSKELNKNNSFSLSQAPLEDSFSFSFLFKAIIILMIIFYLVKFFLNIKRRNKLRQGLLTQSQNFDNNNTNPYSQNNSSNGFFRNMLAGIGGAMAGSWLYDKFFNSHAHANNYSPASDDFQENSLNSNTATEQNPDDFFSHTAGDFERQNDWESLQNSEDIHSDFTDDW